MGKTYELSADAILYTVILCQEPQIYGVKNVLLGLEPSQFAGYAQKSQMELMEHKYGQLNFDGSFQLDEELEKLIKSCSSCKKIIGVDKKWKSNKGQLTCYVTEQGVDALELVEGNQYRLCENVDLTEKILEYIGFPEKNEDLSQVVVDSTLVTQGDKNGLMEAGCSNQVSDLVTEAFRGNRKVVAISKVEDGKLSECITYLYGEEGILEVLAQYNLEKEMLCLTPMTPEEIKARIGALK